MIHYPDTSFLCSLYRDQEHTDRAVELRAKLGEILHFTSLLEFEFLQAIELQVWLHSNDKTRGYTRREANRMIADWESDGASGINRLVPFDMDAVLQLSRAYSLQTTATGGHRRPPWCEKIPDLRQTPEGARGARGTQGFEIGFYHGR